MTDPRQLTFPHRLSADQDRLRPAHHPVVIVGAGPVGLVAALELARKGHRTIVAGPEGRSFVNLTGNPGMATGGTGDLLTGMIAAWIAQLLDAEGACKLSVYLHGAAGDLAEADEGQIALMATDIAGRLGDAMLDLGGRRNSQQSD